MGEGVDDLKVAFDRAYFARVPIITAAQRDDAVMAGIEAVVSAMQEVCDG